MAPLSSGLNNASNPTVPCHCNLGLLFLEKKVNLHTIPPSLVFDTRDGAVHEHVCAPERELVCACVHKREGRHESRDYM